MEVPRHDQAPEPALGRAGARLRAPRAAGVAGILFAVLFISVLVFVRAPAEGASGTFATWYGTAGRSRITLMGAYGIPMAGIAFLWFIGAIRARIGSREDQLFATVFLGSGLLFVAMLFAAAATASAMALRLETLGAPGMVDPDVLQFSQALTNAFLYVYAARAAGVFMIVTSTIAMRTGTIPRWVAYAGYLIALFLLLTIKEFQLIITLFPLWVALLSVFILVSAPYAGGDVSTAGPGGAG